MLKLFLAAAIALAISPAAARDIQCQRWTDAKGRNLEKCDYVDQAPQATPSPSPTPPAVAQAPHAPMKTLESIRQMVSAQQPWTWSEEVKPHSWLMESYQMYVMVFRCVQAHIRYPSTAGGRYPYGLEMDDAMLRDAQADLKVIEAEALRQDPDLQSRIPSMQVEANRLRIDDYQRCYWMLQLLDSMAAELKP